MKVGSLQTGSVNSLCVTAPEQSIEKSNYFSGQWVHYDDAVTGKHGNHVLDAKLVHAEQAKRGEMRKARRLRTEPVENIAREIQSLINTVFTRFTNYNYMITVELCSFECICTIIIQTTEPYWTLQKKAPTCNTNFWSMYRFAMLGWKSGFSKKRSRNS